jgi:glycosyltransferase involved in cell wall biosynthesis
METSRPVPGKRILTRPRADMPAALSSKPELSIILPVYNEQSSIAVLLERLEKLLQNAVDIKAEIIFVDDHSTDDSPGLLKAACQKNEGYRYLRLARNSGSHVAILAALQHARGDCAVFLASDLQDPPELIPRMLELWRMGSHVVWAVREYREGISWFERFLAGAFYRLLNRFGDVKLSPQGSDFALLDRKVVDALIESVGSNPSLGGEIARLGFRQARVPYTKEKRQFGQSKYNLERRLKAFADAFVSFSFKPLRAMSYLGMSCSFIGFLYAMIIIIQRFTISTPVMGWASLMVVVLVVGGIQMTMLGVIGEYLWRTLEESRRRPQFFLEDSCGFERIEDGKRSISKIVS